MRLQFYIYLVEYIILCNQYYMGNALVGANVKEATDNDYSFVACITNRVDSILPDRDLICTGTLISKKDILLSEHCVNGKSPQTIQAVIGSVNIFNGKVYYTSRIISYDKWARSIERPIEYEENDVAIIKLDRSVEDIKPAKLLYKSDKTLYNVDAVMAGWGTSNDFTASRKLLIVKIKLLKKSSCEKQVSQLSNERLVLEPRLLCTSQSPFALLQFGDSGGPLLYHNKVIAINKGTAPLPELKIHPEKVNIHFNVKYYKDFILSVIKMND